MRPIRRRFNPMLTAMLVGALGALALSDEPSAQAVQPLAPEPWVIGDSIGIGIAGAMSRASIHNISGAIISTTARQWLASLRAANFPWPPFRRLVVVSLGTNDAQTAELRREFNANALAIVAELQRRGHVVCWVLPPSESSLIPQPLDIERLTAAGVRVLWERVPMADTWHPTAAGYDDLARVIARVKATQG